ncbi:MAG: NusG domain II-containing protein [Clostridiales bacterium]|jgi:hypothetical protein|nr:NusG domain II-containing protein [Clostridiales bacterium]
MVDERKIDIIRSGKPCRVADIIAAAIILAAAAVVFAAALTKKGGAVEITHNGQRQTYPLDRDREIDVGGLLTVVIKDGAVRVTEAACPDKLCIHQGAVRHAGRAIVCAPNGIVIRVTGGSGGGSDAVSG